MAANQVSGDGALSGMSTAQLYDIMSQMKMLLDQNKQQARLILIQNPPLAKALFHAQVMLGMVQAPQATPTTTTSTPPQNSHPAAVPRQRTTNQAPALFSQNQKRKLNPSQPIPSNSQTVSVSPPNLLPQSNPNLQPQYLPPHRSQPVEQPTGHLTSQPTPMSISPSSAQIPGLTPFPQHSSPQSLPQHQPATPSLSAPQSQQPMQNRQYMPQQPPVPAQPRPSQNPAFSHPGQYQMGQNPGSQHPSGPQMRTSQHLFHGVQSGTNPSSGPGPSFPQGRITHSNQPLTNSVYQAGSPRMGVDYNQVGSSKQPDRGSSWMTTGPPADNASGTQIPGLLPPQMGPTNQLAQPSSLSPEMEKALLQQVMSLTPEQINMLPTDQRNQVLQLQQMLLRQ